LEAQPRAFALKLAYDGTKFAGTNPQPDRRTVHGEFMRALRPLKVRFAAASKGVPFASRTDKGVSALGNCVGLRLHYPETAEQLVPGLNQELENVAVVGAATVPMDFHPRRAKARVYTYHMLLEEEIDENAITEAAAIFVGKHDFSAFATREAHLKGRPGAYESTIESIRVVRSGPIVSITFRGSRFWWNMIRRMVPALEAYARAQVTLEAIQAMLEGRPPVGPLVRIAPPEPLILDDVIYDGVKFELDPAWLRPKRDWLQSLRQSAAATSAFADGVNALLVR
jgi:tRNA pseudouridine38-40 synthase